VFCGETTGQKVSGSGSNVMQLISRIDSQIKGSLMDFYVAS